MPIPLILLFVVVVAGLMVWAVVAAAKRRQEMDAFAAQHGLRLSRERDYSIEDQFPAFDCFRNGSNRYAENTLSGQWRGRSFFGCDYHYETHSTNAKGQRQTHHHHFSAVVLSSSVPLQELAIRPENFFDKITEFFGWDDIDFESAEFSRKFHVSAPNKRWAYDVIHTRAMEQLLAAPMFMIRFDRHQVIAWRNSTFRVPEFGVAAEVVAGLLDGLPEYVVRQQQGE